MELPCKIEYVQNGAVAKWVSDTEIRGATAFFCI